METWLTYVILLVDLKLHDVLDQYQSSSKIHDRILNWNAKV